MIVTLPAELVPAVNSEVAKVVSLRANRNLAMLLVVATAVTAAAAGFFAGTPDPKGEPATGTVTLGLYIGLALTIAAAAAFGAVGAGGEYRHRTMPLTTLFTVDRDRVLAAKLLVTALATLAMTVVVEVIAVGFGLGFGRDKYELTTGLFEVLGGGLLAPVCWALIGASLGLLLRAGSGTVVILFGWLLVVEPLIWVLAHAFDADGMVTLLPGAATIGTVAVGSFQESGFLAPTPAAIVVLLVWTVVLCGAAWWYLRRRDL